MMQALNPSKLLNGQYMYSKNQENVHYNLVHLLKYEKKV